MKKKSKRRKLSLPGMLCYVHEKQAFPDGVPCFWSKLILSVSFWCRAAIAAMEKQELARIIALADLKERMKGKEAMALEQGKKMAEIAAEVKFSL